MVCVGLLTLELALGEGTSLKDKRHVIRHILDSVRHKYNVSAAEVGQLDSLRRSELAFCMVSNQKSFTNTVLDKVLSEVLSDPRIEVIDQTLEFL